MHNATDAGVLRAPARARPASKDLRDDTWWKIGDQGATGSCVGWATADSVLRWHFVQAGRLPKSRALSPRFTWMASKETDQFVTQPTTFIEAAGTSLKAALEVSREWGAVKDAVLPFRSGKLYAGETATFYALVAQLRITAYFNLGVDPADWRLWLANNGPILTRLDVDGTWDRANAEQGPADDVPASTARGGHAVALVGYTSTGFIVRNSWGTGWGTGVRVRHQRLRRQGVHRGIRRHGLTGVLARPPEGGFPPAGLAVSTIAGATGAAPSVMGIPDDHPDQPRETS